MIKRTLVGKGNPPFSHATRFGNLIFLSGQASVDLETGEIIGGTFADEMRRALSNVRTILTNAGGRWEDILKVNCYLRRDSDLDEYNQIYREYFLEPLPARTTITKCLPPIILFEIDCVAAVKEIGE